MQPQSTTEFKRGLGQARALLRRAFGHWPGAPVWNEQSSLGWYSGRSSDVQNKVATIDGLSLGEMERALTKFLHYHREHLPYVIPKASQWLVRASNCLELLKDFLYKPPSARPTWSETMQRLALPDRRRQQLIQLGFRWPALQSLLTRIAFWELTDPRGKQFASLDWLESHAQSLADLGNGNEGLRTSWLLIQVGPHIDCDWLKTLFDFLRRGELGDTNLVAFVRADELAQRLRCLIKGKAVQHSEVSLPETLGDAFENHLRQLATKKPAEIKRVTAFLGAAVSGDLGALVQALISRARREERRLNKELQKVDELGVENYLALVGQQWALSNAHVVTNLREESQSILRLLELAKWLIEDSKTQFPSHTAIRLLRLGQQLPVANRIHLIFEWHSQGWDRINKLLPALTELLERRGMHGQLRRHWLRRMWPSVSSQSNLRDLVACGVEYAAADGWGRAIKLLEHLVYDSGERLTEQSTTAMVKLGAAASHMELAKTLWAKLDMQSILESSMECLQAARWFTADAKEFCNLLRWFESNAWIAASCLQLRSNCTSPALADLLSRLIVRRDGVSINRWRESLDIVQCLHGALPDSASEAIVWIGQYPAVFSDVLSKLAATCSQAEAIAKKVLGDHYRSREEITAELKFLESTLSEWQSDQKRTSERQKRITRRIDNLKRQLVSPRKLSAQRQSRLMDKLLVRADQAVLADLWMLGQSTLEQKLGMDDSAALRERLRWPPYDRLLPAIQKLNSTQQQLAWRALGSSWDDSLKLLSEPANQQFVQRMLQLGLKLDAWLSSDLALEGQRADGTQYRVAFTSDPLDILLMGYHFGTCLDLNGINFYSTISNLVDANKRVVYGKTASGQVVGRCLFTLTTHGKLKTYYRYRHSVEDGFVELVDRFAAQLAESLGTTQTDTGRVPCLVSRGWYDDGCMPVPTSPRGKAEQLNELMTQLPEAEPYDLALGLFGSSEAIIQSATQLDEYGIFSWLRPVLSFFPKLCHERRIALSLRLRMASKLWESGHRDLARSVFDELSERDLYRSLGRRTLYDLLCERSFVDLVLDKDLLLARRLLRRSRPNYVHSDEQEEQVERRYLLERVGDGMKRIEIE